MFPGTSEATKYIHFPFAFSQYFSCFFSYIDFQSSKKLFNREEFVLEEVVVLNLWGWGSLISGSPEHKLVHGSFLLELPLIN